MDRISYKELKQLGVKLNDVYSYEKNGQKVSIGAVYIGEKRCPVKDEWYISGAIPEAYKASNDLSNEYHIAKLVLYRIETVTRMIEAKNTN